jgi:hypothetical protein
LTQLILATTNPAKLRALAERVGPDISLELLPGSAQTLEPDEETEQGVSFAEVAIAKAVWYSRRIAESVIVATDGGLLIPGLGPGWNPLQTARSAGMTAADSDRVRALLALVRDLTGAERQIMWTESLAGARSGALLASWTATGPPGELATAAVPEQFHGRGFWVPAIWRCPDFGGRLLSDLTDGERLSRRDHWAILGDLLTGWLGGQT